MTDSLAIRQANERVQRARKAFDVLQHSRDFSEIEQAWSQILIAASTIYSKLEQGSKVSKEAASWFGRIKAERKSDELLRYVHHARNSDEHVLEEISEPRAGTVGVKRMQGGLMIQTPSPQGPVIQYWGNHPPEIEVKKPTIILKRVTDPRYGDSFDPPTHHLGQPVEAEALQVAEKLIDYLTKLIVAAQHFGI